MLASMGDAINELRDFADYLRGIATTAIEWDNVECPYGKLFNERVIVCCKKLYSLVPHLNGDHIDCTPDLCEITARSQQWDAALSEQHGDGTDGTETTLDGETRQEAVSRFVIEYCARKTKERSDMVAGAAEEEKDVAARAEFKFMNLAKRDPVYLAMCAEIEKFTNSSDNHVSLIGRSRMSTSACENFFASFVVLTHGKRINYTARRMHELFVMIVAQRRKFGWVKFPLKLLREMGIPFSEKLVQAATRKQHAVEYDRRYNLNRTRRKHRKRLQVAKTASHEALTARDVAKDPSLQYKGKEKKNQQLRRELTANPARISDGPRGSIFGPTGSREAAAKPGSRGVARMCNSCSTTHGQATAEGCFHARAPVPDCGTVPAEHLIIMDDLFR